MAHDFVTLSDFTSAQLMRLFRLADRCKHNRRFGRGVLTGNTFALVFEKPSVRTRVAFEVAIQQLGGSTIYLGPEDAQLDRREPIQDVAQTLSRYVEGIIVRTFHHEKVVEFARYASVPVVNGLSDLHHPCQALADFFTMQERFGRLSGLTIGYIGDGNNVLHALMQGASLLGVHLQIATPNGYQPDQAIWRQAIRNRPSRRARLTWNPEPILAASKADILYTDVWTSMGKEHERTARRRAFARFQINRKLLAAAKPGCLVMHCLPAHRGEEITEEVLEGPRSVVFEQAENRLHVQKALLLMLYGGKTQR